MNRRDFFGKLLLGGSTFAILPGAGRIWKAALAECDPEFKCLMIDPPPRYKLASYIYDETIDGPDLLWHQESFLSRHTSQEGKAAIEKIFKESEYYRKHGVDLRPLKNGSIRMEYIGMPVW